MVKFIFCLLLMFVFNKVELIVCLCVILLFKVVCVLLGIVFWVINFLFSDVIFVCILFNVFCLVESNFCKLFSEICLNDGIVIVLFFNLVRLFWFFFRFVLECLILLFNVLLFVFCFVIWVNNDWVFCKVFNVVFVILVCFVFCNVVICVCNVFLFGKLVCVIEILKIIVVKMKKYFFIINYFYGWVLV